MEVGLLGELVAGAGAGVVADRGRVCGQLAAGRERAEPGVSPPMRRPLARGVLSPALCVSVCWRRGELGALAVLWLLLIWRRGDEALLAPGAGDDDW